MIIRKRRREQNIDLRFRWSASCQPGEDWWPGVGSNRRPSAFQIPLIVLRASVGPQMGVNRSWFVQYAVVPLLQRLLQATSTLDGPVGWAKRGVSMPEGLSGSAADPAKRPQCAQRVGARGWLLIVYLDRHHRLNGLPDSSSESRNTSRASTGRLRTVRYALQGGGYGR
jgi:hypothetical protein